MLAQNRLLIMVSVRTTPEKVQILRGWSLAEKTCQELLGYKQIASDVIRDSQKLWPAVRPVRKE